MAAGDFDDIIVTKVSVSERFKKCYGITFHLVCVKSSENVIDEDVVMKLEEDEGWSSLRIKMISEMKERIDGYLREQVLYTDSSMDSSVTYVDDWLTNEYV